MNYATVTDYVFMHVSIAVMVLIGSMTVACLYLVTIACIRRIMIYVTCIRHYMRICYYMITVMCTRRSSPYASQVQPQAFCAQP